MRIKVFQVNERDAGIRLDKWFYRNIPEMHFIIVAKLIRKGQVRLDSKRVKINTKISCNQVIRTPIVTLQWQHKKKYLPPNNFETFKKKFFDSIIYEDKYLIAINKSYNLCVQSGSNVKISIVCILKILNLKYFIVHRLDRYTTGLLLIAKDITVTTELNRLFRENKINKTYLAILSGIPADKQRTIESIINTYDGGSQKKRIAKTKYEVLSVYNNSLSFVKMIPITGRKHQLRIHSKELQCPILGDKRYSNHKSKDNVIITKYLHLHSYLLRFWLFNKSYSLKAPVPRHFENTLEKYFQYIPK